MPVLWAVREGIVFVSLIGNFEFHEIQSAMIDACSDPSTPQTASVLIDGRLSLVPLTPDEAQRRSEWFGDLLARHIFGRCAIVSGISESRRKVLDEGIAGLARAGLPIRSFSSFADAVAWLKA